MRVISIPFVFILLASMAGCSSTINIQPPIHTVTATIQSDETQIFWLKERQGKPEKLIALSLMEHDAKYSAEYRWFDGSVREIRGEGNVWIDEKLTPKSLIIRYNTQGLAVYQNYRLDGDLLPIQNAELIRYFKHAEQALKKARELNKNKQNFFQGYWNDSVFEACENKDEKTLSFSESVPKHFIQQMEEQSYFIAAIGQIGRKTNTIEQIILLDPGRTDCFQRPVFES